MSKNKKLAKKVAKEFEHLKKLVLEKAKIKKGTVEDNIKLGSMGSWAELAGNCDYVIPELGYITVHGTCGEYCKGCFNSENPRESECYVFKSYMKYTKRNEDDTVGDILKNECSVKLGHAYRTLAMTLFREDLLLSLDKQLVNNKRSKNPMKVIRGNESGELTCYEDLEFWCELLRRHPEVTFYIYTKNYKAVRKAIAMNIIPENVFINISIWHKYGIKQYLEFSHHPQIKAFAVVDDEWTIDKYNRNGLIIEVMCGAYDEKGKMNHNVTCDKCKICFNPRIKVCGCYKH